MSYLVDEKYLFTGDTLSLINNKVEPFVESFNMDTSTEKKSILILSGLKGIQYLFTAHFGYADDFNKAFENIK